MTAATTALNLTGKALTPGAQRSWWLREALAAEKDGLACPPLTGDIKADVVIVGGGFTGLWTAYHLTQTKPDLKVVVLEQDICGGGPSGRNGGFASGWWDELREIGAPEELRALTREEVEARCASPAFRSGAFMKDGASVQPAFLARGLRRVVMERGVTIHEGTPVTSLNAGPPAVAITPNGTVRATRAVLAVNAWGVGWPQLRRRLVAWSSYIVLTAPAPEKVAEIGWTGGELITDFRTSVRYFRTTRDGRIAFGGGGGRASSRIDDSFTHDMRAVEEAAEGFRRLFPSFSEVPLEDAWGGPIDVSSTHLPTFGTLEPGNLFYALGYTGNGVAPTHLAGKVIADLVTGSDTDSTRLPMVNRKARLFPPEPLRSIGAAVVRRAIIAKDTAEETGRRPNAVMSAIARMPRRMGYLLGP